MSFSGKRWLCAAPVEAAAAALAGETGLLPAAVQVLVNRGIKNAAAARAFLNPSLDQLASPWLMRGMEQAVARLMEALEQDQKIIIHGDYDADGVTATVIMVETLRALGGRVDLYLPSRFAGGYGLHREALDRFKDSEADLVVSVDCGINAFTEALYARQIGLDLIITDHHQPLSETPPDAAAVINPLQEGCRYPFKTLSGAGIAFQLAAALREKCGRDYPTALLDLAALGTIADVVPLLGENRVLAALGIAEMNLGRRPGLNALVEAGGFKRDKLTGGTVAFILAPLLNAAGRLGEADPAARLLLERDLDRARELAEYLQQENRRRRELELNILKEAEAVISDAPAAAGEKVITLGGEGWHHGVLGIVASRLVERFHRPVVLIGLENGEGRGSARSIPGFNITEALTACAPLLSRYGGHAQAAGLTMDASRVGPLREELNRFAVTRLRDEDLIPPLRLEGELAAEGLSLELARQLAAMEPFGTGNPAPVFFSRDWAVDSWRPVGATKTHLKLNLKKDGLAVAPIFFSAAPLAGALGKGRTIDIAFKLRDSFFKSEPVLEIELKDMRYSDCARRGRLEVIDRRGRHDRLSYMKELLGGSGETAVYVSTKSRQTELARLLPAAGRALFFTGTTDYAGYTPPSQGFGQLILFDLPLDERAVEMFINHSGPAENPRIYLLYSAADRQRNRLLLDLALPSSTALAEIYRAMLESAAAGSQGLPGPAGEKLPFNPGKSFWNRCRVIFEELGLSDNPGAIAAALEPGTPNWPEFLEQSPAYRAARELRQKCELYQEQLMSETCDTLAQRWAALGCKSPLVQDARRERQETGKS